MVEFICDGFDEAGWKRSVNYFIYWKAFFTSKSISKCHTATKIQPVYFILAYFYPVTAKSQPRIYDIEYWRSYGPFQSKTPQLIKIRIVTLYNFIEIWLTCDRRVSLFLCAKILSEDPYLNKALYKYSNLLWSRAFLHFQLLCDLSRSRAIIFNGSP